MSEHRVATPDEIAAMKIDGFLAGNGSVAEREVSGIVDHVRIEHGIQIPDLHGPWGEIQEQQVRKYSSILFAHYAAERRGELVGKRYRGSN